MNDTLMRASTVQYFLGKFAELESDLFYAWVQEPQDEEVKDMLDTVRQIMERHKN